MANHIAIWSLKRGIIDPPELVVMPPERKPVQPAGIEDMWFQQGHDLAQEKHMAQLQHRKTIDKRYRERRKHRKAAA